MFNLVVTNVPGPAVPALRRRRAHARRLPRRPAGQGPGGRHRAHVLRRWRVLRAQRRPRRDDRRRRARRVPREPRSQALLDTVPRRTRRAAPEPVAPRRHAPAGRRGPPQARPRTPRGGPWSRPPIRRAAGARGRRPTTGEAWATGPSRHPRAPRVRSPPPRRAASCRPLGPPSAAREHRPVLSDPAREVLAPWRRAPRSPHPRAARHAGPVRVYLPLTADRSSPRCTPSGVLAPGPLAAHAVTPRLRAAWDGSDDEELEYAVLMAAAFDSLVAIGATHARAAPGRGRRRRRRRRRARRRRRDGGERRHRRTALARAGGARRRRRRRGRDRHRRARRLPAALAGDGPALGAVSLTDHELLWFATQEIPDLLGAG